MFLHPEKGSILGTTANYKTLVRRISSGGLNRIITSAVSRLDPCFCLASNCYKKPQLCPEKETGEMHLIERLFLPSILDMIFSFFQL